MNSASLINLYLSERKIRANKSRLALGAPGYSVAVNAVTGEAYHFTEACLVGHHPSAPDAVLQTDVPVFQSKLVVIAGTDGTQCTSDIISKLQKLPELEKGNVLRKMAAMTVPKTRNRAANPAMKPHYV